jgi:hypothetical protein
VNGTQQSEPSLPGDEVVIAELSEHTTEVRKRQLVRFQKGLIPHRLGGGAGQQVVLQELIDRLEYGCFAVWRVRSWWMLAAAAATSAVQPCTPKTLLITQSDSQAVQVTAHEHASEGEEGRYES